MKVAKLLEKLEEFQRLLKEFERQNRFLQGRSGLGAHDDDAPRGHYSQDDFRLLLIRQYHRLRPYIETYSCCFRSVSADGSEGAEIYEVLIEKTSADFTVLYDDLNQIQDRLRQYNPDTVLDEKGRPLESPGSSA